MYHPNLSFGRDAANRALPSQERTNNRRVASSFFDHALYDQRPHRLTVFHHPQRTTHSPSDLRSSIRQATHAAACVMGRTPIRHRPCWPMPARPTKRSHRSRPRRTCSSPPPTVRHPSLSLRWMRRPNSVPDMGDHVAAMPLSSSTVGSIPNRFEERTRPINVQFPGYSRFNLSQNRG